MMEEDYLAQAEQFVSFQFPWIKEQYKNRKIFSSCYIDSIFKNNKIIGVDLLLRYDPPIGITVLIGGNRSKYIITSVVEALELNDAANKYHLPNRVKLYTDTEKANKRGIRLFNKVIKNEDFTLNKIYLVKYIKTLLEVIGYEGSITESYGIVKKMDNDTEERYYRIAEPPAMEFSGENIKVIFCTYYYYAKGPLNKWTLLVKPNGEIISYKMEYPLKEYMGK
ncbi:MAG: hypothetical protein AB1896_08070 [Thermodesulfobacteriota bacterium]